MKPALYLITIFIQLTMISTQKQNNSEGINEILDKLIKQTENGSENGAAFDKVTKMENDSKIIYLQPNKKPTGYDNSSNITRKFMNINKREEKNSSDASASEEIIMEMNDRSSGETEEKQNIMKNLEQVLKFNSNDESDEIIKPPTREPHDDREEIPEIMMNQSTNNDYQKKLDDLIKDMVQPSEAANVYKLGKIKSLTDDNRKLKKILRQLFSSEDTGILRSAAEYNEPLSTLGNRMNVHHSFAHQTPSAHQTYSLGAEAQQNLLMQTLKNEASLKLNLLQNVKAQEAYNSLPVIPAFAPPPPNVIRTVIHHAPLYDLPTYVDGWRTGQPCCVS